MHEENLCLRLCVSSNLYFSHKESIFEVIQSVYRLFIHVSDGVYQRMVDFQKLCWVVLNLQEGKSSVDALLFILYLGNCTRKISF